MPLGRRCCCRVGARAAQPCSPPSAGGADDRLHAAEAVQVRAGRLDAQGTHAQHAQDVRARAAGDRGRANSRGVGGEAQGPHCKRRQGGPGHAGKGARARRRGLALRLLHRLQRVSRGAQALQQAPRQCAQGRRRRPDRALGRRRGRQGHGGRKHDFALDASPVGPSLSLSSRLHRPLPAHAPAAATARRAQRARMLSCLERCFVVVGRAAARRSRTTTSPTWRTASRTRATWA